MHIGPYSRKKTDNRYVEKKRLGGRCGGSISIISEIMLQSGSLCLAGKENLGGQGIGAEIGVTPFKKEKRSQ